MGVVGVGQCQALLFPNGRHLEVEHNTGLKVNCPVFYDDLQKIDFTGPKYCLFFLLHS